jgi:hypothetical protein
VRALSRYAILQLDPIDSGHADVGNHGIDGVDRISLQERFC